MPLNWTKYSSILDMLFFLNLIDFSLIPKDELPFNPLSTCIEKTPLLVAGDESPTSLFWCSIKFLIVFAETCPAVPTYAEFLTQLGHEKKDKSSLHITRGRITKMLPKHRP